MIAYRADGGILINDHDFSDSWKAGTEVAPDLHIIRNLGARFFKHSLAPIWR
jgi:hypothetical protein